MTVTIVVQIMEQPYKMANISESYTYGKLKGKLTFYKEV